jgi:hypothetical protein
MMAVGGGGVKLVVFVFVLLEVCTEALDLAD